MVLCCRNRAVHGDIVAVELLPQSQWGTKSNALVDDGESGVVSVEFRSE